MRYATRSFVFFSDLTFLPLSIVHRILKACRVRVQKTRGYEMLGADELANCCVADACVFSLCVGSCVRISTHYHRLDTRITSNRPAGLAISLFFPFPQSRLGQVLAHWRIGTHMLTDKSGLINQFSDFHLLHMSSSSLCVLILA